MKAFVTLAALALPLLVAAPAFAQIKPMHSGHMSHGAAQMRAHGSGLHHPNRPDHHHHFGHAGYRPVHHGFY